MAASAFKVFREAKKNLGNTTIDLSSGVYKIVLIKSAAGTMLSANTSASTWASLVTDGITEMGEVGGYSSSGETLANVSWTRSGTNIKFDAQDFSISVTADLSVVKACVIRESAGDNILCYATLSSSGFDVSNGNKLIIQFAASGIFVLS
jgi:hypothetical protein